MQDEMNPLEPQNTPSAAPTPPVPEAPPEMSGELPNGEVDHEGAMAKADLYKLANYSFKLFKKIDDQDQLEAWVQSKITKAADYIASVYHYLEYEMKFSEYGSKIENSDMYSESQKIALKNMLMEAKGKVKDLKKMQADKQNSKTVEEGMFGGDEECSACGGTGHVVKPDRQIPGHVKAKVDAYNSKARAMSAATKRVDKNHNGIPDDEEVDEEFSSDSKPGDTYKTKTGVATKTSSGMSHKNTSYHDDGDEIASNARSGKGTKTHAKSQSAAEKKEKAPAQKMLPKSAKAWGMKDSEKFDNRDGAPAKPKKAKEVDETYGKGVYEATDTVEKDASGKVKSWKHEGDWEKSTGKKDGRGKVTHLSDKARRETEKKSKEVAEAKEEKFDALKHVKNPTKGEKDAAKDVKRGSYADRSAMLKSAEKDGRLKEAKPSAKDPKAVAAAAMWKNVKEDVKVEEAEKKAKKDYDGDGKIETGKEEHKGSVDKAIKANEKETVKESAETTRIRALMQRLNG